MRGEPRKLFAARIESFGHMMQSVLYGVARAVADAETRLIEMIPPTPAEKSLQSLEAWHQLVAAASQRSDEGMLFAVPSCWIEAPQ